MHTHRAPQKERVGVEGKAAHDRAVRACTPALDSGPLLLARRRACLPSRPAPGGAVSACWRSGPSTLGGPESLPHLRGPR